MNEEFLLHGPKLTAHTLVLATLISKCLEQQEMTAIHAALTDQIGEQLRLLGGSENQEYATKMEAAANNELDMLFSAALSMKR